MQPSRFIQQAIPRIRGSKQHTSTSDPPIQTFTNQTSQIRETKNRAYDLPREDHCTPESFRSLPNEVRWKNLLRHLHRSAACRKLALIFVCRMLELAKGFEPLTP
jgi:hypothetical protein